MSWNTVRQFDVLIVGAGPTGTACALALKDSGLKVGLLDKASFPRDKVCGDAITGKAVKALAALAAGYVEELSRLQPKMDLHATRFATSQGIEGTLNWKLKNFICKRLHFDDFLLHLVAKNTDTEIITGTGVSSAELTADHAQVQTNSGTFSGKILVGCDGAQSVIAKQLAGFTVNRDHYSGAVRAYYTNVKGCREGRNEVFYSKKFRPGYFWIFPAGDDVCNVGFGMLSRTIARRRLNLPQSLFDVIGSFPELKERFAEATLLSKPQGMGLPLGTRKLSISGHRYLLCGDAASLIDPLSGDGIGNGMVSGILAAEHIIANSPAPSFTSEINKAYDRKVYAELGPELRKNTRILRLESRFPFLIDAGFYLLSDKFPLSGQVRKWI